MLKRNMKWTAVFAIVVSLTATIAVNAVEVVHSPSEKGEKQTEERMDHCKHQSSFDSVLEKILGLSEEDITNARKSEKNAFDLAKEKGMTADQLRKALIEAEERAIDEKVNKGEMPKERGEAVKTKFKERIEKWDGCLCHNEDCKKK